MGAGIATICADDGTLGIHHSKQGVSKGEASNAKPQPFLAHGQWTEKALAEET
jgi:hypothetical protein